MTLQGDDCYFFYYSTCTKGDSCPFRHCEAAMGSEAVCSLWQEQRCFRNICKFRHMEIKKNRKEIACYWENQPDGCQKPHCAFHHEKPRVINGNYFAPDKGQVKEKEPAPNEEQVNQVPTPTANPTNPQLRGVIRTETQENVPSPTHPPVVINPVDDDDEDDQFSEEGDESLGSSPRKLITSKNDSLNFGIQTLEEIRLRKALMANLKKAGQSNTQGSAQNNGTTIEKENIQSRLEINNARIDSSVNETGKRKITDRLGKRILKRDTPVEEGLPLKRRLAERLGEIVESSTDVTPQQAQKPVRERLGLTTDPSSSESEPKSSGEIRIKTLEEIRQEKAARNLNTSKVVRVVKESSAKELSPTKKSVKSASGPQVKTFSEILQEKKKNQEKKSQQVKTADKSPEKSEGPSSAEAPVKERSPPAGEVRVKTLEEIRREKAARMQAQVQETTDDKIPTSSEVESSGPPKRRILRINKTSPATGQTKPDIPEKKLEPATEANGKNSPSSESVKVKTFEEIMREKKLRKLQEEQITSSNQKDTGLPAPAASSPASESSVQPQSTAKPRIALKAKTSPVPAAVAPQESSLQLSGDNAPSTNTPKPSTSPVIPVQIAEGTIQPVETKVKPKVNVKPSVVKPATQPTQKRKAAAKVHSAVAEVKPLNAAFQTPSSMVIPNKRLKVASPTSQTDVQSDIQQVPSNTEDVQKVPVTHLEPTSTTSAQTVVVPQSPVVRTPSVQRSRRSSTTTGRPPAVTSSSVDEFEDLLDEFTDDRLEDDLELDPGKGEDDLLLELSEMIDS